MKSRIIDYINSTYLSLDDIAEFADKATIKNAKVITIPEDVILDKRPDLSILLADNKLVVIVVGSTNINDVLEALDSFVCADDTDLFNDVEDVDDINEDDDEE